MTMSGCLTMCGAEAHNFPASCARQFTLLFSCVENTGVARINCAAMGFPYQDCLPANGLAMDCARTAP
jgi:hypothetical protein